MERPESSLSLQIGVMGGRDEFASTPSRSEEAHELAGHVHDGLVVGLAASGRPMVAAPAYL
jgi:hypothetical protein